MWRLVSTWETTRSGSIRKRDWQMGHVLSFSPSAAADVYLCLFVLVILKHCYSSFHPFSNFQQVHFCKYSHEAESMEAAKSQFSYICLSCQALLKARKRVLAIPVGRATFNYWEFWISDGKHNCLWCLRKEYAIWLILHCFAFKKGWFHSVSEAGLILDLVLMIFT